MNGCFRPRRWRSFACRRLGAGYGGSQIVEFALSLPLLVLFVVGIFDFSGALSLKQKLTNAAREGARVAAADPANDLGDASGLLPVSVSDAYQAVDNYLISEKVNDCGLQGTTPTETATLIWTSPTLTGCPNNSGLVLTINRGCVVQQTSGTYAVNTCVTILYPYPWQFGGVTGLFGGRFALPTGIPATAVAFNEN
jgi:Flp pilus assembly protein TadG